MLLYTPMSPTRQDVPRNTPSRERLQKTVKDWPNRVKITLSPEITRSKCYEKESKIALKKAEELMRKNGMSLRIILH
jgi:hypothetical protein